MATQYESNIGKEDLSIQTNTNVAETFNRKTPAGGSITLTKLPDIWNGTGYINVGKIDAQGDGELNIHESITKSKPVVDITHPDFGADPTGVADSTNAIKAAIATLTAGGVVFCPAGTYLISSTLDISVDGISLIGQGRRATTLKFNPSGTDIAVHIEQSPTGTTIVAAKVKGITFNGTGDTTNKKTAIQVIDGEEILIEDVEVRNWTGNTSIGIQFKGRQAHDIRDIMIFADLPIDIEDDPNSTFDCDHYHFCNCYLASKTDNSQPVINIATGVNVTNLIFDGYQAWIYGTHGLYWSDTTTTGQAYNVAIKNVRWEQSTAGAGHYMVYITHNTNVRNLFIEDCYGGSLTTSDGFYLRKCIQVTLKDSSYAGTGTALNVNSTVTELMLENVYFEQNSTVTATGLYKIWEMNKESTNCPVATWAYYAKTAITNNCDMQLMHTRYYAYQGAVTDDGTIAMTFPYTGTVCQMLVSCSAGTGTIEGGHWVIATETLDGAAVKISGSSNTAAADSDTKLCVFKNVGTNQFYVKNRLGETRTVQVILWWL